MNMKQWMVVSCAAAVTGSGCAESQVDPSLEITLSGKVLEEDGQPLANTLVNIDRSTNSECVFSIFGGGNWKTVKTGTDGTFSLDLLGADTQNGSTARCFTLRPPNGSNGRSVSAQFLIQHDTVQVPTLQHWSGGPTAAATTNGVNVTIQQLSAAQPGADGTHSISVSKSGSRIWVSDQAQATTLLNDYQLEDASSLTANISAARKVESGGSTFNIYYSGDPVSLPKRGLVPVSRGASCTYTEAPTVCPLTDGDLSTPISLKEGVKELVIQLPQAKVLRKAVLRNLDSFSAPTEMVLEGSSNGVSWVGLANLHKGGVIPSFIETDLSHPAPLSQVRVRVSTTDNNFRLSVSEVSLFE